MSFDSCVQNLSNALKDRSGANPAVFLVGNPSPGPSALVNDAQVLVPGIPDYIEEPAV